MVTVVATCVARLLSTCVVALSPRGGGRVPCFVPPAQEPRDEHPPPRPGDAPTVPAGAVARRGLLLRPRERRRQGHQEVSTTHGGGAVVVFGGGAVVVCLERQCVSIRRLSLSAHWPTRRFDVVEGCSFFDAATVGTETTSHEDDGGVAMMRARHGVVIIWSIGIPMAVLFQSVAHSSAYPPAICPLRYFAAKPSAVRQFDAIRRATLHSTAVQRREVNLERAWYEHLKDLVDKFFPGDLAW